MSGLRQQVDDTNLMKLETAFRAPAIYAAGAGQLLFTITGGPVWIVGFIGHAIAALDPGATGVTGRLLVNAVNVCAATAIASAINTILVFPLEDTGALPIVVNALASSYPTPAAHTTGFVAVMASPGTITFTVVGAAGTVGAVAFYCTYYRMNRASNIA